jgi:hypothetical protein
VAVFVVYIIDKKVFKKSAEYSFLSLMFTDSISSDFSYFLIHIVPDCFNLFLSLFILIYKFHLFSNLIKTFESSFPGY